MPKAFLIDTTRCTACRGCQISCKEWHDHKAVKTKQTGTHQNPPDLTPNNFKLVRFQEHLIDGRVQWLFFPEQCRHCLQPACKAVTDTYVPGAILHEDSTGIVVYTDKSKKLTKEQCDEAQSACPYNIPRRDEATKMLTKCDMCIDRVHEGLQPMCVKTCCTGCMNFGERDAMMKLAEERLAKVKQEFPKAELLDAEDLSVIYLVAFPRELYHQYAQKELTPFNRADFFAMLARPVKNALG